jgi:hypothetical protein
MSRGLAVLTFGKAFYANKGLTPHFSDWKQVEAWFQSCLQNTSQSLSPELSNFLENVWRDSFRAELYDLNKANVEDFAQAIQSRSR